ELSYRRNTALVSNTVAVVPPALLDFAGTEGARGDTLHALVNGLVVLPKNALWDTATLQGELVYSRLRRVTSRPELFNGVGHACAPGQGVDQGCATRSVWLAQIGFEPQWLQVGPGIDLSAPVSLAYGLRGNGATLGGNLGTGSPIGDSLPVQLALEASVVLASTGGRRTVALADYFTGYRQTVRRPGELIAEVVVPLPAARVTAFHKIAKRAFDDISSVAAAFALDVADSVVVRARIGLGGVAATPLRATATEAALEGRPWTIQTVAAAAEVLAAEGTPLSDQRASSAYRSAMLGQSLHKLFAEVTG
ncbi:MAG: DUF1302 family protein, partial [Solirubrobacteraceae bacterium]|nr:DUF1302 family protein [Solirubrobacteraceae bacterium]